MRPDWEANALRAKVDLLYQIWKRVRERPSQDSGGSGNHSHEGPGTRAPSDTVSGEQEGPTPLLPPPAEKGGSETSPEAIACLFLDELEQKEASMGTGNGSGFSGDGQWGYSHPRGLAAWLPAELHSGLHTISGHDSMQSNSKLRNEMVNRDVRLSSDGATGGPSPRSALANAMSAIQRAKMINESGGLILSSGWGGQSLGGEGAGGGDGGGLMSSEPRAGLGSQLREAEPQQGVAAIAEPGQQEVREGKISHGLVVLFLNRAGRYSRGVSWSLFSSPQATGKSLVTCISGSVGSASGAYLHNVAAQPNDGQLREPTASAILPNMADLGPGLNIRTGQCHAHVVHMLEA